MARRECPNQGSVLHYDRYETYKFLGVDREYGIGTAKYDGLIRKYRDLKAEWKNSNIFQKEVFFK